ncbi:uncharacterized protein LOC142335896 isoform X2 [Convolutriloba macropyga]|uniref:uncharacterized protein LOC142335896 isoform X2 n=1 Tax=Convolutriloba macropyga TaxID=536237 RepID=UPI003F51F357
MSRNYPSNNSAIYPSYSTSNREYGAHSSSFNTPLTKPAIHRKTEHSTTGSQYTPTSNSNYRSNTKASLAKTNNSISSHLNKDRSLHDRSEQFSRPQRDETDLSRQQNRNKNSTKISEYSPGYSHKYDEHLNHRSEAQLGRSNPIKNSTLNSNYSPEHINKFYDSNYVFSNDLTRREHNFGGPSTTAGGGSDFSNFTEFGGTSPSRNRKLGNVDQFEMPRERTRRSPVNSPHQSPNTNRFKDERLVARGRDKEKLNKRSKSRSRSRSPAGPPSYKFLSILEESLTKGTVGLENMGNTCYFNSAVQCLSCTTQLRDVVLGANYSIQEKCDTRGRIVTGLKDLLSEIWCTGEPFSSVRPRAFLKAIASSNSQFEGYRQQDSQELLLFVLNALSEETNRVKSVVAKQSERRDSRVLLSRPKSVASLSHDTAAASWKRFLDTEDSFVTDTIAGQLQSSLKCKTCAHTSITYESFFQLSLPVPETNDNFRGVSLDECFKLFCEDEVLEGDNCVLCEKCRNRRECSKSLRVEKLPEVLIIQLKRFSMDFRSKIETPVAAPLTHMCPLQYMSEDQLKLLEHSGKVPLYRLYAVIDHIGTPKFGHYIAKCLVPHAPPDRICEGGRQQSTLVLHPTSPVRGGIGSTSETSVGSGSHFQYKTPTTWWKFDDSYVTPIDTQDVISENNYILFYQIDNDT